MHHVNRESQLPSNMKRPMLYLSVYLPVVEKFEQLFQLSQSIVPEFTLNRGLWHV